MSEPLDKEQLPLDTEVGLNDTFPVEDESVKEPSDHQIKEPEELQEEEEKYESEEEEVKDVEESQEKEQLETPIVDEQNEELPIDSNSINTNKSSSIDVRKSNGLNLNVLNTSSQNILNDKDLEDNHVDDEIVDMDAIKTHEMSVGDMTSLDSYNVISNEKDVLNKEKDKTKWFDISQNNKEKDREVVKEIAKELIDEISQDNNLILNRFKENLHSLELRSVKDKESLIKGNESIKKTFHEVKTGVEYTHNEELIEKIDWEFWSNVVNDYENVVYQRDDELLGHITNGIPDELRGIIWQILCESKSSKIEEFYSNSRNEPTVYEKQIRRDLSRTSFVTTSLKSQIDDLYEIIKAYSIFDKEVGYTQGMAFITVPILLNVEASETFCLLVKLMFTYGFRDFYLPNMPGLRLRMYQLDRLIEEKIPDLAYHFKIEGIKSSMYATQWFLTLFAYKFPLALVLRVFDVVITQGLESILQFSINLLEKNKEKLLTLKFEQLVDFLKEGIFKIYCNAEGNGYLIDEFVIDAMKVSISNIQLKKYLTELEEIDRLEEARDTEIKDLRVKNGQLTRQIREIETAYSILNKEHIEIANEMVKGKMKIGTLEEEKSQLEEFNNDLKSRFQSLKSDNGSTSIDFSGPISESIDIEIQKAMERNLQVMEENMKLEEQLSQLELENSQMKKQSGKSHAGSLFGGLSKGNGKFW